MAKKGGATTNGTQWTQSNITSGNFSSVYYANGMWVLCNAEWRKGLYYSTDGKTWTQINTVLNDYFYTVYNADGIWVAGSNYGLYYSESYIAE